MSQPDHTIDAESNRTPRVPTVGNDPRDASHAPEPEGKTWFRDLDEAVIEADRCTQCGACVAACPSDSIGIDDLEDKPTLVSMCTGCSRCWDFCPRSGLRYERLNRLERDGRPDGVGGTYAARARAETVHDAGQDGGAVTALLSELLEAGAIDAALVVTEDEDPLKGEAYLAETPEQLVESAGSSYNQTMQLGRLTELVEEADLVDPDVAVVGTPCVIQGAAALERYEWDGEVASIALTVSLMCTRSFEYDRLRSLLEREGLDLDGVDRLDVKDGKLYALDESGDRVLTEPVDSFDPAALDGCLECADFVGEAADISAGNIGSAPGYTTVLVQSERGERAWEVGENALEFEPIDEADALDRIVEWNRRRAEEATPRAFDEEAPLTITYEQHREAYDGTDRDLASLNPARVYQYERWC